MCKSSLLVSKASGPAVAGHQREFLLASTHATVTVTASRLGDLGSVVSPSPHSGCAAMEKVMRHSVAAISDPERNETSSHMALLNAASNVIPCEE